MGDFKNNKVLPIIRQFKKDGDRYEINGIDLSKAIFFYKVLNEKFKIIPKGSYTVSNEGGATYLIIQDGTLLSSAIEFQICYKFEISSSEYDTDFPDIVVLKEKYNQVVDDLKTIMLTFGKQGFNLDDITGDSVLPKLEEGTFWVMEEGEAKLKNLKYLDGEYSEKIALLEMDFSNKKSVMEKIKNDTDTLKSQTKVYRDDAENMIDKLYDMFGTTFENEGWIFNGTDGDGLTEFIEGGVA